MDRTLRVRVHELTEAAMHLAIAKAEARVVSRMRTNSSWRDLLRKTAPGQVVAVVGESILETFDLPLDSLLVDAFTATRDRAESLARQTWRHAAKRLRVEVESQDYELLVIAAGENMSTQLRDLARQRLIDPAVAADTPGERSPLDTVPVVIAREFVSRSGGGSALTAGLLARVGVWIARGIGTSDELEQRALAAGTIKPVEEGRWLWVYGMSANEFEPHLELDGLEVEGEDDPQLENSLEWPDNDFFFPGDHAGCQCDLAPFVEET